MDLYLHDSAGIFRFQLAGRLEQAWVSELEHAWITARSALGGKALVVDVSALAGADSRGLDLLRRMRAGGAHLCAVAPVSPEMMRLLGVVAAPAERSGRRGGLANRAVRLLRRWSGKRRAGRTARCRPHPELPAESSGIPE